MKISHDRKNMKLRLSPETYIEKVLERFNMSKVKTTCSPLVGHFKLNSKQCPISENDMKEMSKVSYASTVGSLMYAMVYTRSDIAHVVGVVSRFLYNPGKEHYEVVKWILRYLRGTFSVCLCFDNGELELDGYTYLDIVNDIDSQKVHFRVLDDFCRGSCLSAIQIAYMCCIIHHKS